MQMRIHYKINDYTILPQYATIPIAFMVESVYRVSRIGEAGLGGFKMEEEPVDIPYCKDLDKVPNNGPTDWTRIHDMTHWKVITAWNEDEIIGGTIIYGKVDDKGFNYLFDHRIKPEYRYKGTGKPMIGYNLIAIAKNTLMSDGCKVMGIHNQNTNVYGCKYVVKNGGVLTAIDFSAEVLLPGEVQLFWTHRLGTEPLPLVPIGEEGDGGPAGN